MSTRAGEGPIQKIGARNAMVLRSEVCGSRESRRVCWTTIGASERITEA
jgi:hypothetical protein